MLYFLSMSFESIPTENRRLKPESELAPNIVRVETEDGIFDVVYSLHISENQFEDIAHTDGVILEGVNSFNTQRDESEIPKLFDIHQYKKMFLKTMEAKKPVFLVDAIEFDGHYIDITLKLLEGALGIELFAQISSSKNAKMNRRKFLSTSVKALVGTWLCLPALDSINILVPPYQPLDESSRRRRLDRLLQKKVSSTHPESGRYILDARNYLIAQKSIAVARNMKIDTKPNLAVVIGAAHFEIEEALRMPENERIQQLKRILGDIFNKQGIIAQVTPSSEEENGIQITFYEDPAFQT